MTIPSFQWLWPQALSLSLTFLSHTSNLSANLVITPQYTQNLTTLLNSTATPGPDGIDLCADEFRNLLTRLPASAPTPFSLFSKQRPEGPLKTCQIRSSSVTNRLTTSRCIHLRSQSPCEALSDLVPRFSDLTSQRSSPSPLCSGHTGFLLFSKHAGQIPASGPLHVPAPHLECSTFSLSSVPCSKVPFSHHLL